MAIGDVTQKKLLQKTLTTVLTESAITNIATEKTTITGITVFNSGATKRTVKIYACGTGAANEIFRIPLYSGDSRILTGLDYVLSGTESFYCSQDVGSDVNVTITGITEVIA